MWKRNAQWNHNSEFHPYLLRQFPQQIERALDVGCGLGDFTGQLANRSEFVDALDVDSVVLKKALINHNAANIAYQNADFLEADLPKDSYDVIVCIASLHHMDLELALNKVKGLLRPSGKLLILGLYREIEVLDYLYSAISILLNLIYSSWHHGSVSTSRNNVVSTCPAQLSLQQIQSVANTLIPGYHLQRHLFWRYSLIWQKR